MPRLRIIVLLVATAGAVAAPVGAAQAAEVALPTETQAGVVHLVPALKIGGTASPAAKRGAVRHKHKRKRRSTRHAAHRYRR